MTEPEREHLRRSIIQTLIPENDQVVGLVNEMWIDDYTAYWINIAGEDHFLGSTLDAANFTAKQGDWINLDRYGRPLADDVVWFERRAQLGSDWQSMESSLQREERRRRILYNTELTSPILKTVDPLDMGSTSETAYRSKLRPLLFRVIDDLLCFDILRLEGSSGYWVFDQQFEIHRRIHLSLGQHGFSIHVDTSCPLEIGPIETKQELAAVLKCSDDYELVRLELFRDGKSYVTVQTRENGLNEVTMLKLE